MSIGAYGRATRLAAIGGWPLFVAAVTVATIAPFAIFVAVGTDAIPGGQLGTAGVALLAFLGGNFHVASSGWFYTDPQMRAFFRDRPIRYYAVPLALVIGGASSFAVVPDDVRTAVLSGFLGWQIWHYQKQNVGLLSFIAAGTASGPVSTWERRTLAVAAIGGILGFFSVSGVWPAFLAEHVGWIHRLGALIYCVVPMLALTAIVQNPLLRRSGLRLVFFLIGASFFLPTFIFNHPTAALAGYGAAHGLQYVVFMACVGTDKSQPVIAAAKLLVVGLGGGLLLDKAADMQVHLDSPLAMPLFGAFVGLVAAHFVVDAGLWRLREPFQRGYMRRKFDFIFSR